MAEQKTEKIFRTENRHLRKKKNTNPDKKRCPSEQSSPRSFSFIESQNMQW